MPNLAGFLGGRSPDGFDNPLGEYGFTNEDFVSYVGTAFGEFMGEPEGTYVAGADVIGNRLGNPQILGGTTVYDVLTAPNQFDVWSSTRSSAGGLVNLQHGLQAAFNPTYAARDPRFQEAYNNALFAGQAIFGGPLAVNGYGVGPSRGAANGSTFWNAGGLSPEMQKTHAGYGSGQAVNYGDGRTVFYGHNHIPNPMGFMEAMGRAGATQSKEDPTNLLASQPPDARYGNPDEAARAHAAFGGVTNKGPDEASRALGAAFSGQTDWDALAALDTPSEAAGKGFRSDFQGAPSLDFLNGIGQPLDPLIQDRMSREYGLPGGAPMQQETFDAIFGAGFPQDSLPGQVGVPFPLDITSIPSPGGLPYRNDEFVGVSSKPEDYDAIAPSFSPGDRFAGMDMRDLLPEWTPNDEVQISVDPKNPNYSPEYLDPRGALDLHGDPWSLRSQPWDGSIPTFGMPKGGTDIGEFGGYEGVNPFEAGRARSGLPGTGMEGEPLPANAFRTDYDAVAGFSPGPSVGGPAEQFGPAYTPDPTQAAEDRQNAAIANSGYSPSWSGEDFDAAFADPYGGRAATSSTGSAPSGGGLDMAGFNAAMAQFDRDMASYNAAVTASNQARDFPATANPNSGLQPSNTIGTGANFGVPGSAGSYWGLDQFAEDPNGFAGAMKGGMEPFAGFSVPPAAPTATRAPAPAVGPRPVAPQRAAFTTLQPVAKTAGVAAAPAAGYGSGGGYTADASGLAPGVSYEGSISGRSTNDAFGNNMDTFMGPNWSDSGQMFASTSGGNTDMTGLGKSGGFGSLSPAGGSQDQSLGAFGGILDAIVAAAAAEAFGGQQAGFGGYADPYGGGAYNDAGGYNYR